MKKKNFPIPSIVLFVSAGLLFLYSAWAFIHCQNYISGAISSGQLETSGNEYDIVNFYMSNCSQYTLFAILFFALGWILYKQGALPGGMPSEPAATASRSKEEEDDDLDEWFEEVRQEKGK